MGNLEIIEDCKELTRVLKQQRTKDKSKIERQQQYIDNLAIEFMDFYESLAESKSLSKRYENLYKLLRQGRRISWDSTSKQYKKL